MTDRRKNRREMALDRRKSYIDQLEHVSRGMRVAGKRIAPHNPTQRKRQ